MFGDTDGYLYRRKLTAADQADLDNSPVLTRILATYAETGKPFDFGHTLADKLRRSDGATGNDA